MDNQLRLGETDANITLERAWADALGLLEPEVNRPSFESFFKTAKPLSLEGNRLTLGAASELAKIFLQKYSELIKTALESIFGASVELEFTLLPAEPKKSRSASVKKEQRPQRNISPFSLQLNEKYIFSSFVVGPCNRLAHAAAFSAAKNPGVVYNPFFLYGGPGLGKTHLLQAIGHHVLENHPELYVAYVSGEMFTSHYVTALREHKTEEFRRKYRSIDVWLLDDVQFLAGKERTKEEFFHTFNALYQMNKQIILSSDRSPRNLSPLEERLKSRFESGLVVDIAPPDLETRIAILGNKAESENADVPLPVLTCIAELIQTNIRALEGALVTIMAYSSLMKTPLTPELASQVLGRYVEEKRYTELAPDAVQRAVADAFNIELADILSGSRRKDLVLARHVAMYLCREHTNYSLPAIGRAFGGKDHSTILHGCKRVQALIESDPSVKEIVDTLSSDLKAGRL